MFGKNGFGSLGHALQFAFPEYPWDLSKFSLKGKKASQRWLLVQIRQLLPVAYDIIEDYHHPDLIWGMTWKNDNDNYLIITPIRE